jgi:hypothetical protein
LFTSVLAGALCPAETEVAARVFLHLLPLEAPPAIAARARLHGTQGGDSAVGGGQDVVVCVYECLCMVVCVCVTACVCSCFRLVCNRACIAVCVGAPLPNVQWPVTCRMTLDAARLLFMSLLPSVCCDDALLFELYKHTFKVLNVVYGRLTFDWSPPTQRGTSRSTPHSAAKPGQPALAQGVCIHVGCVGTACVRGVCVRWGWGPGGGAAKSWNPCYCGACGLHARGLGRPCMRFPLPQLNPPPPAVSLAPAGTCRVACVHPRVCVRVRLCWLSACACLAATLGLDAHLCVQGPLLGADTLWRAATGSPLASVANMASAMLVIVHVQLSPLMRSHEALIREQYLHRCMLETAGGVAWLSGGREGTCALARVAGRGQHTVPRPCPARAPAERELWRPTPAPGAPLLADAVVAANQAPTPPALPSDVARRIERALTLVSLFVARCEALDPEVCLCVRSVEPSRRPCGPLMCPSQGYGCVGVRECTWCARMFVRACLCAHVCARMFVRACLRACGCVNACSLGFALYACDGNASLPGGQHPVLRRPALHLAVTRPR